MRLSLNDQNTALAEALTAILKPIVKDAVREAMALNSATQSSTEKPVLTVKEAAELSRLGTSTIRLYVRKRQLRAQKVGSRVLIKRCDLENFLDTKPIDVVRK